MRANPIRPFALALAGLLLTAAQASEEPQVESLTMQPGESASFTLAEGFDHQLLVRAEPNAPGAITIRYEISGGQSRITATSRAGHPLTFSVLADPDGNGGFSPMGEIAIPADGTPATRSWPRPLGAINVGNFEGGPHGEHAHDRPTR